MVQIVAFDVRDNSVQVRPYVSEDQVKEIAEECFGLKLNSNAKIKELDSYDDRNFLVEGDLSGSKETEVNATTTRQFVLKVYNTSFASRYRWYEEINRKVEECFKKCEPHFNISLAIRSTKEDGSMGVLYDLPLLNNVQAKGCELHDIVQKTDLIHIKDDVTYSRHMVRLTPYISGKILDTKIMSNELAYEFGKSAAILDSTLKDYEAPDFDEKQQTKFVWNMLHTKENLDKPYVETIPDPKRKQIYEEILNELNTVTLPRLKHIPKQWIHGDLNDQNILVHNEKVVGIIDFDDMRYSYRVIELAITLMYLTGTSTRERSMDLAKHTFQGYCSVQQLSEVEIDCLYNLMLVRYTQSCCFAEYQYNYIDPGNDYILITYNTAVDNLKYVLSIGKEKFLKKIQEKI